MTTATQRIATDHPASFQPLAAPLTLRLMDVLRMVAALSQPAYIEMPSRKPIHSGQFSLALTAYFAIKRAVASMTRMITFAQMNPAVLFIWKMGSQQPFSTMLIDQSQPISLKMKSLLRVEAIDAGSVW